jgi:hypothetical protein
MTIHATSSTHPPGSWLVAMVGSLLLWGIAYAQAPAPSAGPASYEATNLSIVARSRLGRLLLNDSDNAVALHQLAAGYASTMLASASRPAGPGREPSPRMVAANTGPITHLMGPK